MSAARKRMCPNCGEDHRGKRTLCRKCLQALDRMDKEAPGLKDEMLEAVSGFEGLMKQLGLEDDGEEK